MVLAGFRVVEMGLWVAGPSAGGVLADWGAEVIKLEMPSGDPMRNLFGAMAGSRETRCPPFEMHNRGKKSVTLDVNDPRGGELAARLVATADVFLTNMRPQFLRRAGLDHESLLAVNPRLVYGILTGYGLEGPDKDAPGFDVAAFSARSGLVDRATAPGSAPPTLPGGMGDQVSAMNLVSGVLAALLQRERTGQGQLVATSLLRSGIFCIGMEMSTRVGLGRVAPSASRRKPQNPLMNSYRAADGRWLWLCGAEADRHWEPVVRALGAPELLADERFASTRDRRRNSEALVAAFDAIFARHTRDEWSVILRAHDVWWAPVNTPDDLVADPQVRASGAFVQVPAMGDGGGMSESVAAPVEFGSVKTPSYRGAPHLGADTAGVLTEIGVSAEELRALASAGVTREKGTEDT